MPIPCTQVISYSLTGEVRIRLRSAARTWWRWKAGSPFMSSNWYVFGEAANARGDVLNKVHRLHTLDDAKSVKVDEIVLVACCRRQVYFHRETPLRLPNRPRVLGETTCHSANLLGEELSPLTVPQIGPVGWAEVSIAPTSATKRWAIFLLRVEDARATGETGIWIPASGVGSRDDIDRIHGAIVREVAAWDGFRERR